MQLDIDVKKDGTTCLLAVRGEVDVYTSPLLKSRLGEAVDDGCLDLIVDLEGVSFIDSSGLGALVSGLRRVKERSGSLRVVCTKDNILKVFRITGLDKVFPIVSSAEEAAGF
ncbi:MAG: STAS domain-containing protein [Anaerosomatales bacterium]|nr:STAS domain-containing protein [Anaerosomatales bacterium]GAV31648.1 anti-sigma-B factor antagonist [Coriobacteriaceae bacterium EMTCatB1]